MTNPSQQNKFILEKFREEFVLTPQNWRDNPQQYSVSYVSTSATRIEDFLLSILEQKDVDYEELKWKQENLLKELRIETEMEKDLALAEYKAELIGKIDEMKIKDTKKYPNFRRAALMAKKREGFNQAIDEVLSLINSQ